MAADTMHKARFSITLKIIKIIPVRLKKIFKTIGFTAVVNKLIVKEEGEMMFQSEWVTKYSSKQERVEEYYRKYRLLEDFKKTAGINQLEKK